MRINSYELLGDFNPDYLVTRYFSGTFANPHNNSKLGLDESMTWDTSKQIKDAATFVHEITHYLQFTSTTFGLFYQISKYVRIKLFGDIFNKYVSPNFKLPIIEEILKENHWRNFNEKDLNYFYNALRSITFYLSEINGFVFETDIPITNGENDAEFPKQYKHDLSKLPFKSLIGRNILENHASLNQTTFLSHPDRLNAGGNYFLPSNTDSEDYISINLYLKEIGIEHLSQLIYFTVFNIEPELLSSPKNTYKFFLVNRLLKILKQGTSLKKIDNDYLQIMAKPKEYISKICEICKISNPFDNLNEALRLLSNELKSVKESSTIIQTCEEIIDITIKNPFRLIFFPINPQFLGTNGKEPAIPILFTRYSDTEKAELIFHNVTNKSSEWFSEIHYELYNSKIINDLFMADNLGCPLFDILEVCNCNNIREQIINGDCTLNKFLKNSKIYSFIKEQKL